MTDILSLRVGECRYCTTEDAPFLFCGAPVAADSSYCAKHHQLCHSGFGRVTAEALATMIYNVEQTVTERRPERTHLVAVDVVVRG